MRNQIRILNSYYLHRKQHSNINQKFYGSIEKDIKNAYIDVGKIIEIETKITEITTTTRRQQDFVEKIREHKSINKLQINDSDGHHYKAIESYCFN